MVETPLGLASSEVVFGNVNGDGLPEVAIGRLPVTSAAELQQVVAKIIA